MNDQGQFDIRCYRTPFEQPGLLESEAVLLVFTRLVGGLPIDLHGAAGGRNQPGDHPQQRRLAATGRADQGDELALRHAQIDTVECGDIAFAGGKDLADPRYRDRFFRHAVRPLW